MTDFKQYYIKKEILTKVEKDIKQANNFNFNITKC